MVKTGQRAAIVRYRTQRALQTRCKALQTPAIALQTALHAPAWHGPAGWVLAGRGGAGGAERRSGAARPGGVGGWRGGVALRRGHGPAGRRWRAAGGAPEGARARRGGTARGARWWALAALRRGGRSGGASGGAHGPERPPFRLIRCLHEQKAAIGPGQVCGMIPRPDCRFHGGLPISLTLPLSDSGRVVIGRT